MDHKPNHTAVATYNTVDTRTDHEGPGAEYMYISTLSLTSALDGVGGQRHASAT